MRRVRLSALVVSLLALAHVLIPHSHPWEGGHEMPLAAYAQSDPSCSVVPLGALAGQPFPVWCYDPMEGDAPTFVNGANSWVDDFNHGASLTELGAGYRVFQVGSIGRARHWRHADHWMVDVEGNDADGAPPYDFGAAMMRPDRTFRAVDGVLVIEAEVAAGVVDYQGSVWPELVITTAAAPTQLRPNGTYVYEAFPNHWTVGCRLQADGAPTCALLDNTAGGDSTARVWEISHFQCGNTQGPFCTQKFGGHPSVVPNVHRFCRGTDPDTNCRDRFRWEISADKLTIYVNGTKYMEHSGFPPALRVPAALLNNDVYVYFGDFLFKSGHPVTRFHWDRIAINPNTPGDPPPPPPPPPVVCSPRPKVTMSSVASNGRLLVTVRSSTSPQVPNNQLGQLRFGATTNALIDAGGQTGRTGNFTVSLPADTTQTTFTVRRGTTAVPPLSTTVPLIVADDCGDWTSFVGGGPTAF